MQKAKSPMKLQLPKSKKLIIGTAFVLIIILGSLLDTGSDWIKARQFEGQFETFDSQEKLNGENDPNGFEMLYPVGWRLVAYSNGGHRNLGDQRAGFYEPSLIVAPKTYVSIWWKRVDASWTMYDARDWYIEDIGFGINRSVLQQSRDSFSETYMGKNEYPALENVFNLGKSEKEKVVVFVVGNEAFAINFHGRNYKETEEIFEQMLNSFENYSD